MFMKIWNSVYFWRPLALASLAFAFHLLNKN